MYKIFGCRVEDFSGFLAKIPSFGVKSADVSEILKIFEIFYKNVQNFEKQLKNTAVPSNCARNSTWMLSTGAMNPQLQATKNYSSDNYGLGDE